MAPTGAYVAGRESCVTRVAERLTAPRNRRRRRLLRCQLPAVFSRLLPCAAYGGAGASRRGAGGMRFCPRRLHDTPRVWTARARISFRRLRLETPECLVAFCRAVQAASPVDSFALPGTVGNARLSGSSDHGCGNVRFRRFHRAERGRAHARAVHRLLAGRLDVRALPV